MDHPFIATHYLEWVGPYEDEVRRLGVEYDIADDCPVLGGCAMCRPTFPDEVRHAVLVAEIEDPYYGRVPGDDGSGFVSRVYRIADRQPFHRSGSAHGHHRPAANGTIHATVGEVGHERESDGWTPRRDGRSGRMATVPMTCAPGS